MNCMPWIGLDQTRFGRLKIRQRSSLMWVGFGSMGFVRLPYRSINTAGTPTPTDYLLFIAFSYVVGGHRPKDSARLQQL